MAWRMSLVIVALGTLASGCAQRGLENRVAALESSVARLELMSKKVDGQLEQLGKLSADLEAERAYFKDVKDYVRLMRDDTIGLIDDQRRKVEEGRGEYLRILRRQKDLLVSLQGEIEAAMRELEKTSPEAEAAIAAPPATPGFKASPAEPAPEPSEPGAPQASPVAPAAAADSAVPAAPAPASP